MATLTLKLDESKKWILLRALLMLTSPEGEAALREDFPNMDFERMAKECEELLEQFNPKQKATNDGTQR